MTNSNYITASEIAEYVYCPRGWWLRINGNTKPTAAMTVGTAYHESILSKIKWPLRLRIIALLLIGIALMTILLIIKTIFL